jgi:thioredoxin reductase (NADPH)
VTTKELRELGRKQAERFGVEFKDGNVERIEQIENGFRAFTTVGDYETKTLLFATGVTDVWPRFPDVQNWVGKQVFWCITCDGYRTQGKTVVCFGSSDEAAVTVLQMKLFTDNLTLVADPDLARFCDETLTDLALNRIPMIYARPAALEFDDTSETISAVCLDDGTRLPCDMIFSLLGVRPNTALAREMGVALDDAGYIVNDEEGYASIGGVFAAGDLTQMYTQQVASAVHSGAEAAQTMNYYLYARHQKNVKDREEKGNA